MSGLRKQAKSTLILIPINFPTINIDPCRRKAHLISKGNYESKSESMLKATDIRTS